MNRDDEIFADALELAGAERAAFLDRACRDDAALRRRVEALLASHEAAAGFLERSPHPRPAPRPADQPGDTIGRYTLVRELGTGGCGVVYLAEQTAPVRRHVALKVIKLGMDTRQVIARFGAEQQALALMDHPNIARVFDAGATADGRPFFAMEFVDGVPITKYCDDHSLSMVARLDLFTRVCLAVQHAHQKGIIHRDLKPSNILVSQHDGLPVPKVIDFGIAKATSGRLTAQTLVTGFDQIIGTPAYMSPEQAELRDPDIDTRSDVYSLGVVLYELLAGRPPYDPGALVRAGIEEIRRIIREVEPPRPSTRVSTLTHADRATVARLRRAAPTQLRSALTGDLDWIVMRCLEKDRARRYGTAKELADDLRRHLLLEPVLARPPSALYRGQRFLARHRVACASAAAITAALIVGTVVSVRQAVRATRAERVASAERDIARAATRAEALARADAQRRQEQAETLLTFMLGSFRDDLKKLGQLKMLDAVGEQAMAYFAALDPRDQTDTGLARQAKALYQIGETRIDQAKYAEAAAAFDAAYNSAAALAARHPRDGDMLFERAQAEFWIATVARRRGNLALAREWATHYRDSAVALVALEGNAGRAQREFVSGYHNLAVLDLERGNLAEAQRGFLAERVAREEMLSAQPDDPQIRDRLADVASWLGRVAEADGRLTDAITHRNEMTRRMAELIAHEPAVARWKLRLADGQVLTGDTLAIAGRRSEATALYAAAYATYAALLALDSTNHQWQSAAQFCRLQQIALLLADDDTTAAAPLLAETRVALENLVAAEPAARAFTGHLAIAWMLEARLRQALNRPDALAAAERAITLDDLLLTENRATALVRWNLAQAYLLAGRIARAAGQPDVARARWNRSIEGLGPHPADSNDWRVLDPLAQAHVLLGQPDAARPLIERLRRFGYHPVDPLAASTLEIAR
jgi:serine/threonine protein kinase